MKKKEKNTATKPWQFQTGKYIRDFQFHMVLPNQFLLICKVLAVSPQQLLVDFIDNLSCGSWNREGREESRAALVNYFVLHGYGQTNYQAEEIRRMFKELDHIGSQFPLHNHRLLKAFAKWRKAEQSAFFDRWFYGKDPNRSLTD